MLHVPYSTLCNVICIPFCIIQICVFFYMFSFHVPTLDFTLNCILCYACYILLCVLFHILFCVIQIRNLYFVLFCILFCVLFYLSFQFSFHSKFYSVLSLFYFKFYFKFYFMLHVLTAFCSMHFVTYSILCHSGILTLWPTATATGAADVASDAAVGVPAGRHVVPPPPPRLHVRVHNGARSDGQDDHEQQTQGHPPRHPPQDDKKTATTTISTDEQGRTPRGPAPGDTQRADHHKRR